jgi:hypothetical protein
MKLIVTLIVFHFFSITIVCQTKISGKVTDSNNLPLPGANIFIKDSYDGISSAEDGLFSFTTEEEGNAILVVSFVGYKTKEENIFLTVEDINIQISLEEEAKELGSVVISAGSFEPAMKEKV